MAQWIREVRERRAAPLRPMPDLATARDRLLKSTPSLGEELATEVARASTRAVEGGLVWSVDPLHRTRSPSSFSVETYRAFLRRIACPVLFVEGAASGFRHWVDDDRLSELRDVRPVVVPDAGHMVHHDAPEAVARVVAGFLGA